jgi:hypothetical protein
MRDGRQDRPEALVSKRIEKDMPHFRTMTYLAGNVHSHSRPDENIDMGEIRWNRPAEHANIENNGINIYHNI